MNAITSVAGTIDLPSEDPDLEGASTYVRDVFDRSLRQPMWGKEDPPRSKRRPKRRA